jgi:hypothetical protein
VLFIAIGKAERSLKMKQKDLCLNLKGWTLDL